MAPKLNYEYIIEQAQAVGIQLDMSDCLMIDADDIIRFNRAKDGHTTLRLAPEEMPTCCGMAIIGVNYNSTRPPTAPVIKLAKLVYDYIAQELNVGAFTCTTNTREKGLWPLLEACGFKQTNRFRNPGGSSEVVVWVRVNHPVRQKKAPTKIVD